MNPLGQYIYIFENYRSQCRYQWHFTHLSFFSKISSYPFLHYIPFFLLIFFSSVYGIITISYFLVLSCPATMVGFKYWDDCVDPEDLEAMWQQPAVRKEWIDVGETQGQKVHLSRDPEGQPYLTQTEMRAVAEIVTSRHFDTHIDPEMICTIAELESNRQPLAEQHDKKSKVTTVGIMQISLATAESMAKEYQISLYKIEGDPDILYRPFVNVYFGATYLKWLSNFENKVRTEEFMVRAYKGGTKKATHKSTLPYWKRYISVKETFTPRCRKHSNGPTTQAPTSTALDSSNSDDACLYWDSRVSPEDMREMWNNPEICNEWNKSNQKRGKVLFTLDSEKNPCLSRLELKAVAEIIVNNYFSTMGIKPTALCALAEMVSMRNVDGTEERTGLMGIDYSTAFRLYTEVGFRDYPIDYEEDLTKPFVSMYFGAAYFAWLSMYEGSERDLQFVIQAYISGPENVNPEGMCPEWAKFEQTLAGFEFRERNGGRCTVM
ncbi:uncharacterized protein LOC108463335 isoform X1 [Gossypium arboreum]|uniref:uncharacterized protein LOC108463335 isoform X1 n=2 Tax=Gossypium arboreum TaxID=29729 RepID=UPI0022F1BFF2|nr:uncharacterized protein LOC108463335 isoform X1 [Gossypium arboreum]